MCFCVPCQSGAWSNQWSFTGCKHGNWCGELCGRNTTRGDRIQWQIFFQTQDLSGLLLSTLLALIRLNAVIKFTQTNTIPLATTSWKSYRCFPITNSGQAIALPARLTKTSLSWKPLSILSSLSSKKQVQCMGFIFESILTSWHGFPNSVTSLP